VVTRDGGNDPVPKQMFEVQVWPIVEMATDTKIDLAFVNPTVEVSRDVDKLDFYARRFSL
jgi:hypothetical protein